MGGCGEAGFGGVGGRGESKVQIPHEVDGTERPRDIEAAQVLCPPSSEECSFVFGGGECAGDAGDGGVGERPGVACCGEIVWSV